MSAAKSPIASPGVVEEEEREVLENEYVAPKFDLEDDFDDLPSSGDEGRKISLDESNIPDDYVADQANRETLGVEDEEEDEPQRGKDPAKRENEDDIRERLRRAEAKSSEVDTLKAAIADLQKDREKEREREHEGELQRYESQREKIQGDLKKAIADGDAEAQYEAQVALAEHVASKPEKPKPQQQQEAPSQEAPRLPPKAQAYADRNAWIGNSRYREMNDMLTRVDQEIVGEGYNPQDDEYYQELDSRLRKALPQQADLIRAPRKQRESPVNKRRAETREGKGNKVDRRRLTAGDVNTLRKFGLDPRDKRTASEFLRNKLPDPSD